MVDKVPLNLVGDHLLSMIRDIMLGGDNTVPGNPNQFISWCLPGIPFDESDFDFAKAGLGVTSNTENATREYQMQVQHANSFAQTVDFIPDTTQIYNRDDRERIYSSPQNRLSEMYKEILRLCKVVNRPISEEDQKKIDRFRSLMRTTKKTKNLVTGEESEITVNGPIMELYTEKMNAYIDACLEYNTARSAAQSAYGGPEGKAAVAYWVNNAELLRRKVKAANDAWVSGGYKNEVEQMNAFIDQVSGRNMMIWIRELKDRMEKANLSALGPGQVSYYTEPIPAGFAESKGWVTRGFEYNQVISSESKKTTFDSSLEDESKVSSSDKQTGSTSIRASSSASNKKGGGSIGFFGLSLGGSAASSKASSNKSDRASDSNKAETASSDSHTEYSDNSEIVSSNKEVGDFSISFEITQVLISRPWFYPEFFMNRGWTLRPGEGWYHDMPSDGQTPEPKGCFIAYPTAAIFARNIEIKCKELAEAFRSHMEKSSSTASGGQSSSLKGHTGSSGSDSQENSSSVGGKGEAGLKWGVFSFGGNYGGDSSSQSKSSSSFYNRDNAMREYKKRYSKSTSGSGLDTYSNAVVVGNTILIPGMQIIGFVCQFFGKAPNLDPNIKEDELS